MGKLKLAIHPITTVHRIICNQCGRERERLVIKQGRAMQELQKPFSEPCDYCGYAPKEDDPILREEEYRDRDGYEVERDGRGVWRRVGEER